MKWKTPSAFCAYNFSSIFFFFSGIWMPTRWCVAFHVPMVLLFRHLYCSLLFHINCGSIYVRIFLLLLLQIEYKVTKTKVETIIIIIIFMLTYWLKVKKNKNNDQRKSFKFNAWGWTNSFVYFLFKHANCIQTHSNESFAFATVVNRRNEINFPFWLAPNGKNFLSASICK